MGLQGSRLGDRSASAGERGSKAVDSLDSLLADMETFRTNNAADMDRDKSKKIQIEIETKKKENLEKKLENLTDKLLESFKPDSDVTATARTEDDLDLVTSSLSWQIRI